LRRRHFVIRLVGFAGLKRDIRVVSRMHSQGVHCRPDLLDCLEMLDDLPHPPEWGKPLGPKILLGMIERTTAKQDWVHHTMSESVNSVEHSGGKWTRETHACLCSAHHRILSAGRGRAKSRGSIAPSALRSASRSVRITRPSFVSALKLKVSAKLANVSPALAAAPS